MIDFRYRGVPGNHPAKVIDITLGMVMFEGTLTECRRYKREHFGYFYRIYLV